MGAIGEPIYPNQDSDVERTEAIETRTEQTDPFFIEFNDPEFEVNTSQLNLPLHFTETERQNFEQYYGLSGADIDFLEQNGFARSSNNPYNFSDFGSYYDELYQRYVHMYISSDAFMHAYHVLFNSIMMAVEEDQLYGMLMDLSRGMVNASLDQYNGVSGQFVYDHSYDPDTIFCGPKYDISETIDLKELALANAAYFAVGVKLLDPHYQVPASIKEVAEDEVALINSASSQDNSPLFSKELISEALEYVEDYTQYKPRGHYTESVTLERYFRAMMWYGRMTFRWKSGSETVQAIMLSNALATGSYDSVPLCTTWNALYDITSFFVGSSDEFTYLDYNWLIGNVYGALSSDCSELLDSRSLDNFRNALTLLGGSDICSMVVDVAKDDIYGGSLGLRFMGQRFVADSYVFQNLVFPGIREYQGTGTPFTLSELREEGHTKIRGVPRGMDWMGVTGNDIAEDRLITEGDTEYDDYNRSYGRLKLEMSQVPMSTWGENLYWGWLHTLRSLNEDYSEEQYPTFMRNRAFQSKQLNTALASWAELRHDTLLYAEQSSTGSTGLGGSSLQKSYLEPVPTFYSRLYALTNTTFNGLTALNVLDEEIEWALSNYMDIIEAAERISYKELSESELTSSELCWLNKFNDVYLELFYYVDDDKTDSRMISDVHTDLNNDLHDGIGNNCLEEATGYLDNLVVIVNLKGDIRYFQGPIFSYYEFRHPVNERLTDDEWKTMLDGTPPAQFDWWHVPPQQAEIPVPDPNVLIVSVTNNSMNNTVNYGDELLINTTVYCTGSDLKFTLQFQFEDEDGNVMLEQKQMNMLNGETISVPFGISTLDFDIERIQVEISIINTFPKIYHEAGKKESFNLSIVDNDWDRDGCENGLDAFPHDPAASKDSDGDGHPDEWNEGMSSQKSTTGLQLDLFPLNSTEWADSDGDGVGDNTDRFPTDPTEWIDSDGDGYGDNIDKFPFDVFEWQDSDDDGIPDTKDDFPYDPAASKDSDGDGYPDEWNTHCTQENSTTNLELDGYPMDPNKWTYVEEVEVEKTNETVQTTKEVEKPGNKTTIPDPVSITDVNETENETFSKPVTEPFIDDPLVEERPGPDTTIHRQLVSISIIGLILFTVIISIVVLVYTCVLKKEFRIRK